MERFKNNISEQHEKSLHNCEQKSQMVSVLILPQFTIYHKIIY